MMRERLDTAILLVVGSYRAANMRMRGEGVAKHSYHIKGVAIDLRSPAWDKSATALSLQCGGVGYAPRPTSSTSIAGRSPLVGAGGRLRLSRPTARNLAITALVCREAKANI